MRSFDQPVEVDCYSGYKADERPIRFRAGGAVFEIERILDQWRTPDGQCFRIRAAGGDYILRHYDSVDLWTLHPSRARFRKDPA